MASANVGFTMGWTAPVNVKLLNVTESPLDEPISISQRSWIGSLFSVGSVFSPFIAGYLAPRIGRKWSVLSCSIPLLIGWILMSVASELGFIYSARILWGVGAGMMFCMVPMYCAEIATVECRGALGSYLQVFISSGFLLVYGVGPYISYYDITYVGIAFVTVFMVAFCFMPDTPIYCLTKNDKESAAKSLMFLRGKSREGVEHELVILEAEVQASNAKTATLADVFRGSNFKAFYIGCALAFFQQCCGVNAVLYNLTTIFKASGSNLDPAIATIIVGAVQLVASMMTPFVADRLGRRILLLISTTGTTLAHAFLGIYFYLDSTKSPVAADLGFLPLLSMMLFIITYCWGLGPMPFAIMSELFPIEVKAVASPILISFSCGLTFLVTRYFEPIAASVGMHSAFWMFGACCAAGFVFTLFLLPETKGRSIAQIQDLLAGRAQKKSQLDTGDKKTEPVDYKINE